MGRGRRIGDGCAEKRAECGEKGDEGGKVQWQVEKGQLEEGKEVG